MMIQAQNGKHFNTCSAADGLMPKGLIKEVALDQDYRYEDTCL